MAYNARMAAPARVISPPLSRRASARSLYARDLYSWTREQCAALRLRDAGAIDWDNVIEEIESLGNEQESKWTSLAARAIEHLLKIQHWPHAQSPTLRKWEHEVGTWRRDMARVIRKNPGLQGAYGELLELAWHDGRNDAIASLVKAGTEIEGVARRKYLRAEWQDRIPLKCPWPLEEIVAYDPQLPKGRTARRRRIRFGRNRTRRYSPRRLPTASPPPPAPATPSPPPHPSPIRRSRPLAAAVSRGMIVLLARDEATDDIVQRSVRIDLGTIPPQQVLEDVPLVVGERNGHAVRPLAPTHRRRSRFAGACMPAREEGPRHG